MWPSRLLGGLIAFGALTALLAATLAPLLASAGHVEAVPLYLALERVCRQAPDRSWFFNGLQAGLCLRCYGIFGGILLAATGAFRFTRRMLAAGALLMAVSWGIEAAGAMRPPEWTRLASGVAFGAAAGAVVQPGTRSRT